LVPVVPSPAGDLSPVGGAPGWDGGVRGVWRGSKRHVGASASPQARLLDAFGRRP